MKPSLHTIFEYNTIKASDELTRIANDILRYDIPKEDIVTSLRQMADHMSTQYREHEAAFKVAKLKNVARIEIEHYKTTFYDENDEEITYL
ncbi:hypothetical protein M3649_03760 [Ureibacillus chungkukjangi]|uniref:hypothetical protein n=1 Tax=Ureibacillus chungkukjangi TaxID=1202712 RepID=UPI0020418E56|nr:hypothetical protein [Ureibacillus chungkukjangi]MCM3387247.1 hypothetical protein [Ureibacillus chungkukjangi]